MLIGSGNDCYVYIKWKDDVVEPHHAKLTYENGNVILSAIAETLVNDRPLFKGEKVTLRDKRYYSIG